MPNIQSGFKAIKGKSPIPNTDPRHYHAHRAKWKKENQAHDKGEEIPKGHELYIMSRSELADFSICPRKWMLAPKEDPTAAMKDGSLFDTLVLSHSKFSDSYEISPEMYPCKPTPKDPVSEKPWNYQAGYCKEWRAEREAEGKQVCTQTQLDEAEKAIKRLYQDPETEALLSNSQFQVMMEVEWHDGPTGLVIPFKALIDILPNAAGPFGKAVADLKRTADASWDKWQRHCYDQKHFYQAAMYLDIVNAATGLNYGEFMNVISESEAPYEPARRVFTRDFIQLGQMLYRQHLHLYCECVKSGKWPGYEQFQTENPLHPVVDGWRLVDTLPWMTKKEA